MKNYKRLLACLLAFFMILTYVPVGYAAELDEPLQEVSEFLQEEGDPAGLISEGGLLEESGSVYDGTYDHAHDAEILSALDKLETSLDVTGWGLTRSNFKEIVSGLLNRHPEYFYVSYSGHYYGGSEAIVLLDFTYSATQSEIRAMRAEIDAEIAKIDQQIDTTGMTVEEVALAYHDYLVSTIAYDYEGYLNKQIADTCYTMYGALVKKRAVCQGYAEAFSYLMNRKNLPCGIASSVKANHAWNVVYIDGKWYQMDATWDDPVWDNLGRVDHTWFLTSDATMLSMKSNKSDYVTSVPEGYTYEKATDQTYENGFWKNVGTYMYPYQGNWYYLEAVKTGLSSSGADAFKKYQLAKYNYGQKKQTVLYGPEDALWYAASGGYYISQYGRMAAKNGTILYSTPTTIERYAIATGEKTTVFTLPSDTAKGTYIYGLGYVDGNLNYVIKSSPNSTGAETYTKYTGCTTHVPGEAQTEIETEATCKSEGTGYKVVKCQVCGKEISRTKVTLPKTEHTVVVDKAVAATCTTEGLTEGSHCSVCKEVLLAQKKIAKTDHVPGEAQTEIETEATCKSEGTGYKVVKCQACGKEISRTEVTLPKTEHIESDWIIDKQATVDAAGSKHKVCVVCKEVVKEETIEKLPAPDPTPGTKPDPTPGTKPDPTPGTGAGSLQDVAPAVITRYTTHVQSIGWQGDEYDASKWFEDGAMAGTSGRAKRLEGIKIRISGNSKLGIQYTTHCQTYGWLPWSANGEMNGTTGEAKRLEAIKIQLTGADKDKYDVYYRVHAQSYGWLGWAKNGACAGTAGQAKRLEGIQIVVVKRGDPAPGLSYAGVTVTSNANSGKPYVSLIAGNIVIPGDANGTNIMYKTHVQSFGWQNWVLNGTMSGTSGKAKRLEGINIKLSNAQYAGGIEYRTHIQKNGWEQRWKKDGAMSGTSGEAKRLEAIQIRLYGEMAEKYDVYYRVHAQSFGWLGWAKNGEESGTAGLAKRLEGIQIVLVPKNGAAPAANYGNIQSVNAKAYIKK